VSVLAGLRLSHTSEERESEGEEANEVEHIEEMNRDTRDKTRLGGAVGISWRAWSSDAYELVLYADYRNTYKPAAIDFGPESEAENLAPETAECIEAGFKAHLAGGALEFDFSAFDMRFENLVVSQSVNGRPSLTNAGEEHFKGAELEVQWNARADLT